MENLVREILVKLGEDPTREGLEETLLGLLQEEGPYDLTEIWQEIRERG